MPLQWDQEKFKAQIAGKVARNMERACVFVVEQARVPKRTGKLRRSIGHEVHVWGNRIEGRVGSRHGFYRSHVAWFMEMGTSKMAARPWLRPAVFNNADRIVKIIEGKE